MAAELAKAAGNYRKAQAAVEKATVDLEKAILEDGWREAHRHLSDGKTVSLLYRDESGETKRFDEFAATGGVGGQNFR